MVSYPGVMAAASEVGLALAESAMLSRFETTFAYLQSGGVGKLVRALSGTAFGKRVDKEMSRRAIPLIPEDLIHCHPVREVIRIALSRAGAGEVLADRLWEWMTLDFDRRVSKGLHGDVDAIYGYEHSSRASFERAKALGIACIYDAAAPHFTWYEPILSKEIEKFPELQTHYHEHTRRLASKREDHKARELGMADLIVANSTLTAESLRRAGVSPGIIRTVPLGAPPIDASWRRAPRRSKTTILFAGTISIRKGAHYLLDAWNQVGSGDGAELLMAGRWTMPDRLLPKVGSSVRVLGSIPRKDLDELYRSSAVLVLPSLCDGFGMVVTEALAHGLPVIVTSNVGAADVIREGHNGWIIPPGNSALLADRLDWCLSHPSELHQMREAAESSALANQWSNYRKRFREALTQYLAGREAPLATGSDRS